MPTVPADSVSLLLNRESSAKTASTGAKSWLRLMPTTGGIQGLRAMLGSVAREVLSENLTPEAGDVVSLEVSPKIVHDLGKDIVDAYAGDWYRCTPVHAGNKGKSDYRPTAVTSTGYTVPSLGDLTAKLLIYAKGFSIAANNGLKEVASSSTGTEIKASGLTAETNPTNATVDVVGVVGALGDITLTSSGHLASTTLDFTTLGLSVGQRIKIGGTATGTFFASDQNSYAEIVSVATNLITLKGWSLPVSGADSGTGKTIQLFFSRFYRNYPISNAKFSRLTSQLELGQPGAGDAGATSYRYVKGLRHGELEVDAPLKGKIAVTMSFVGLDCPDPVLAGSRPSDTATALDPLGIALFDSTNDVKHILLATASTGADLSDGTKWIESWKLSQKLGVKPVEVQGTLGAAGHTEGMIMPSLSISGYLTYHELIKAMRDNRDVSFTVILANEDCGLAFHIPAAKLRGGDETMALGDAVKISLDVPAHRNTTTGIISSLSVFGHIPT